MKVIRLLEKWCLEHPEVPIISISAAGVALVFRRLKEKTGIEIYSHVLKKLLQQNAIDPVCP